MKKKTKKGLIIFACIVVILAVCGYFGYNHVMDYLSDKAMTMLISDQLEGMLESGEITFEEVEQISTGQPVEEAKPEESEETVAAPTAGKGEPTPPPAEQKTAEEKKETIKTASKKITDTIPREEKQAMMKLISSRLTKADITYLASLAAGGLEGKEISEAYKIAKERFSPEELEQVRSYWHKYKTTVLAPKKEPEEK